MKTVNRLIATATAIVLIAGCSQASSPTPSTTPVPPSQATTASAAVAGEPQPMPAAGRVEPGRYRVGDPFPAPFDVTFDGESWNTYSLDPCCIMIEQNFHLPPGLLFFSVWQIDEIYEDPCEHTPIKGFGPAAADLAAAYRAIPGYHASETVDVVVGGMPGKRLTLSIPAADVSDCAIEYRLWGFDGQNTRYVPDGYPDGEDALWILDVDGSRIVIDGMLSAPTDADRAELERMVDSIAFVEP